MGYEFKYIDIDIKYKKISIDIEYYRWCFIKKIKNKIFDIFNKYEIKAIKNDLYTNIDNVIARILFENFSSDKIHKIDDGLLFYKKNSCSLHNDLKTTFTKNKKNIPDYLCKNIIKE